MHNKLEKNVLKILLLLAVIIFGCKVTNGWFAWLLVAVGCWASIHDKRSIIIECYIFLPLLLNLSPVLVGRGGYLGLAARLGQFIILFSMLLTPAPKLSVTIRKNKTNYIPLEWLFVYMAIAALSSINGWMPLISYFKINIVVLLIYVL